MNKFLNGTDCLTLCTHCLITDQHKFISSSHFLDNKICIRLQKVENFSFWYLQSFKLIWDLTGSMIREGAALASEKSRKIFRFSNIWKSVYMNIVWSPSHQILLFSMEEQIRAIIGLPVLWSRHVRHLDSGLCSNAPMPHTQCPLNNRTLLLLPNICKKIFPSYGNPHFHIAPPYKLCKKLNLIISA